MASVNAARMARFRVLYREGFELGVVSGNPFRHRVYFAGSSRQAMWDRKVFVHGFMRGIVKYTQARVAEIRLIQRELEEVLRDVRR